MSLEQALDFKVHSKYQAKNLFISLGWKLFVFIFCLILGFHLGGFIKKFSSPQPHPPIDISGMISRAEASKAQKLERYIQKEEYLFSQFDSQSTRFSTTSQLSVEQMMKNIERNHADASYQLYRDSLKKLLVIPDIHQKLTTQQIQLLQRNFHDRLHSEIVKTSEELIKESPKKEITDYSMDKLIFLEKRELADIDLLFKRIQTHRYISESLIFNK